VANSVFDPGIEVNSRISVSGQTY